MTVLVTGAAGFIGSAVAATLMARGERVVGLDNLNSYYSVSLKRSRLKNLAASPNFTFVEADIRDLDPADPRYSSCRTAIHLAAQAGVRHSLTHPEDYVQSNLVGFARVLEFSRALALEHLVYASSSSVYGANEERPFSVMDQVNQPVSLYAATKRSNELMAESYSHLFSLPMTGLRFFTVYGPWGRPDMAIFSFTDAIIRGQPIRVYGGGKLTRDFTFIDDIADGVVRCHDKAPDPRTRNGQGINETAAPHRIFNLGNTNGVSVNQMIDQLERALGLPAIRDEVPRQPGDVEHTLADIGATTEWCGYTPQTPFSEGATRFVAWYLEYYAEAARVLGR